MNTLQLALAGDDEARRLFNELVEKHAHDSGRSFDAVYRELETAFNGLLIYVIEEEP